MTMVAIMITITAAQFKTHCLRLMDRAQIQKESIIITKRGIPVAKIVPFQEEPEIFFGYLKGMAVTHGDIVAGLDEKWEAESE